MKKKEKMKKNYNKENEWKNKKEENETWMKNLKNNFTKIEEKWKQSVIEMKDKQEGN